jgi:RNA polymerase sigma-70 factor, ECF subfamily
MDRGGRGQVKGVKVRPLSPSDEPAAPPRAGFPELFEEHGQYVMRSLRRLGARGTELEDLTHDVFIQVFRRIAEYDPRRPVKPWLFAFALRVASQDRRRLRRRPEIVADVTDMSDPMPDPSDQLLTQERRELARAALEELELNRRAVFILHELDGCAIPEVARSLDIPLATAYSRLRLAREDFAQTLHRLRSRQR